MKKVVFFLLYFFAVCSLFVFSQEMTSEEYGIEDVFNLVKEGDLSQLKTFAVSDLRELKDDDGNNLLHWAALYNKPKICDYLLKIGISPLEKNNLGQTPLQLAKKFGSYQVLPILEEHGSLNYLLWIFMGILLLAIIFYFFQKRGSRKKGGKKQRHSTNVSSSSPSFSDNPLVSAILNSEPAKVEKHLNDVRLLNKVGEKGLTPLLAAISVKANKWIELLFLRGVNLDDFEGKSPLAFALKEGNFEIINYLIAKSEDINIHFKKSNPFLLLNKNSNLTPSQREEIIKFLIKKGLKISKFLSKEVLEDIFKNNSEDFVLFILKSDKEMKFDSNTLLELASKYKFEKVFSFLVSKKKKVDLDFLYLLLENDRLDLLEKFLKSNPELVKLKSRSGETFLHYLIKKKKKDLIDLVLQLGADPNQEDDDGYFPLIIALFYGEFEIFKLLVEGGADIFKKTKRQKETLLHLAVSKKRLEFVKYILKKGVNPNEKDLKGTIPLEIAIKNGSEEIVKILKPKTDLRLLGRKEGGEI